MSLQIMQLGDRLQKALQSLIELCNQYAGLNSENHIVKRLNELEQYVASRQILSEIYLPNHKYREGGNNSFASFSILDLENLWQNNAGLNVKIVEYTTDNAPIRYAGSPVPTLKFFLGCNVEVGCDEIWWIKESHEGSILFLYECSPPADLKSSIPYLFNIQTGEDWKENFVNLINEESFKTLITAVHFRQIAKSIEKSIAAIDVFMQNEHTDISILKRQTSIEVSTLGSNTNNNTREWISKFKIDLQKQLQDIEIELQQNIDSNFLKSPTSILTEVKEQIAEFKEFEEENKHDCVEISVPIGFSNLISNHIKNRTNTVVNQIILNINNALKNIETNTINSIKQNFGENSFHCVFRLDRNKTDEIINESYDPPIFKSELPIKNYIVYLKGIREPIGIIMLGFMLYRFIWEPFVKEPEKSSNKAETAQTSPADIPTETKLPDTYIYILAFLIIGLMAFFSWYNLRNFNLTYLKKYEKELTKAKETLLQQYGRFVSEQHKKTKSYVSEEVKRMYQNLLDSVEESLQLQQEKMKSKQQERESNIQRKTKGIEMREKSYIEFERQLSMYKKNLEQWIVDWKKQQMSLSRK